MVMHMLRFANFSHAELLSLGAYFALVFDKLFKALIPAAGTPIGPLSLTASTGLAVIVSMLLTGFSAVLFDRLIFRRVREKGEELSMVFASFGLSLIIRSVIGLVFGLETHLFSQDIVFATMLSSDPLVLVKPDQLATFVVVLIVIAILHLVLSRTTFGYALRAVAENPGLAQVNGINLQAMIAIVWITGGALAAMARRVLWHRQPG